MSDIKALKHELATASRIIYREGLVEGFGHISTRVPGTNTFLIPPRMSPALVRPEDILTIDLEGEKVAGEKLPNSETPLHTRVYRMRPEVNSVAHTHSPMVTTLGVAGQVVRPLHNGGTVFHAGVAFFRRPGLINTDELADQMAACLGQLNAVMLRGHGATVVAPGLKQAVLWALALEEGARYQVWASAIGSPLFFDEADIEAVGRDLFIEAGGQTQVMRAWNYYSSRIEAF